MVTPLLVAITGSSVPVDGPQCITPKLCQAAEYAHRCENAWRKEFTNNVALRKRIRELEALISQP